MAFYFYKTKKIVKIKGEKRTIYVATKHVQNTMTEKDIAKKLSKSFSMEAPEVLLLMDELADQIRDAVLSGKSVKVEGLGTFSPSLKCTSEDDPKDVNAENILAMKINFRMDADLRRKIANVPMKYYNEYDKDHA